MAEQTLIRTITAPITADPDWASDPALTPPDGESVSVDPGGRSAYFTFLARDADGVEIALGAMTLDFTGVVELSVPDKRIPSGGVYISMLRELDVVGGTGALIEAKKIAVESDLPDNAVQVYPRMRGNAVDPPATIATLEIYGGMYR